MWEKPCRTVTQTAAEASFCRAGCRREGLFPGDIKYLRDLSVHRRLKLCSA